MSGKCFTRSRTSTSASAHAGSSSSCTALARLLRGPPGVQFTPDALARLALEQARDAMGRVVGQRLELRIDAAMAFAHVRAAGVEGAASGQRDQARRQAGDRDQRLVARAVQPRDRPQQAPGVGMLGRAEDLVRRRGLDDPARVHHHDLVGHLGDHPEVVGDQHDGHAELALEPRDQLQDLGLHGHVQGGRGLVGDQQLGLVRQCHRDHRALPHAPRELVRICVDALARVGDADHPEQLDGALPGGGLRDLAMRLHRLDELAAHLVEGVQGGQRVLEDHRDVVAPHAPQLVVGEREQVTAVEADRSGDARVLRAREAHHGEHRDALARARLADDADGLAGLDGKRDAVHGLHDSVLRREAHAQVADLEQRGHQYRTRGSRNA